MCSSLHLAEAVNYFTFTVEFVAIMLESANLHRCLDKLEVRVWVLSSTFFIIQGCLFKHQQRSKKKKSVAKLQIYIN